MIPHAFKPDPHGRDVCDQKSDEDGRIEFCGQRRSEHMDEVQGLRVQLAAALKERDEAKDRERYWRDRVSDMQAGVASLRAESGRLETAARAYIEGHELALSRAETAEQERDALRTALTDIVTLCMDVADTEDWRAKVGDKARKALHGEPGWKQT